MKCHLTTRLGRMGPPLGATAVLLVLAGSASAQSPPAFLGEWGSLGSGDGSFNFPTGIAADSSGNVYVADRLNHRVQKFDSSGAFLAKWGSAGSGPGQFASPSDVAVDGGGNVYIVEAGNNRVQKFDSSGTYLTSWGSPGSGPGQFSGPEGIGADTSGNVYVADTANNRIQRFDSSGTYLLEWASGTGSAGCPGGNVCDSPRGVAPDNMGNVYVVSFNSRVQKFDASGGFSGVIWGAASTIRFPEGLAVDATGNVYVAVTGFEEIQKYDGLGNTLLEWGSLGTGNGEFNDPYGVAVDSSGNVYVADTRNNRIQKFGALEVGIDIKPGSEPNCFNINGHGVIPVAVLGSPTFDVLAIDTATLMFDGLVVRVRGKKGPLCSLEETDGDGYTDLVCHFEDETENWIGGGSTGTVTGQLLDGTPIHGSDSVCVVP
jgi:streptogramin lyase